MTAPTLYLWFPGTAAEALGFYRDTFGGELVLHTLGEMGRSDGPADAVGHGVVTGPVTLFGSDVVGDEAPLSMTGLSIALLGTADGPTLTRWFSSLAEGGTVLDDLQERPWGRATGSGHDQVTSATPPTVSCSRSIRRAREASRLVPEAIGA